MMKLLAGAFAGFAAMVGGMFGGHASTTPMHGEMHDGMGSTTPMHMGSTTPMHGDHMGSSTPEHMMGMMSGMRGSMQGVMGKVTAVDGTTLTVSGHAGRDTATTTYTVDASSAKVIKGTNSSATLSDVAAGDLVMVGGPVSGTSITAKVVIDGIPMGRGMMMRDGMQPNSGKPPVSPAHQ